MPSSTYKYLVMDPLGSRNPIVTEKKTIQQGKFNAGTVTDTATAQEIKQRYPHYIVQEFESNNNGKSVRATFTMPEMPWKYSLEKQNQFAERFNKIYQYLKEQNE